MNRWEPLKDDGRLAIPLDGDEPPRHKSPMIRPKTEVDLDKRLEERPAAALKDGLDTLRLGERQELERGAARPLLAALPLADQ